MTGYHTRWARPEEWADDPERIAIGEALAFGKAVYDVRTALRLTVSDLTSRAGTTDAEIECLEEGSTESTIALLRQLAAAFNADVRLTAGHDLGSVWFEPTPPNPSEGLTVETRQMSKIADVDRAALTGTSAAKAPHITGRLWLALACVSVLLIGAVTGCSGSSSTPPKPGANSAATGQPATAQSGGAPAWGARTHLDSSQGGGDLTSVSCPSASFCMAVLGSGYATIYDGTTWSKPSLLSSSGGEPDSVSCPTVSFCMAVDARDSSTFLFNGSRWSPAPSINDPAPTTQTGVASVSCSSPSFCAAVDNGSNAFTFNGAAWSPAAAIDPGNQLSTVSCPSASFCAAVDYGPNVVTFNGASWSKPSAIAPGSYLQAVSCASARFCVALDRKGSALTFNGSSWSRPVNAYPDGLTMGEGGVSWPIVSCPTSNFCAAVDGAGGNVVTFDGRNWTAPVNIDPEAANSVNGPVLIFLMSVSCPSATFCVVGDTTGNAFVRN
jgi:transcriptional regulator with XRE-family HTH domain